MKAFLFGLLISVSSFADKTVPVKIKSSEFPRLTTTVTQDFQSSLRVEGLDIYLKGEYIDSKHDRRKIDFTYLKDGVFLIEDSVTHSRYEIKRVW